MPPDQLYPALEAETSPLPRLDAPAAPHGKDRAARSRTAMRVTLIDNYDSFTFNLVHYLGELGADVTVWRNDESSGRRGARRRARRASCCRPAPARPNEAGICLDLVRAASATTPMLGVCLGHQAIGQVFGGEVVRAPLPMHGKVSRVSPQRARPVSRRQRAVSGDALSFAGHRTRERARRARDHGRDRRRPHHGGGAPRPARARRAVPSRKHRQRTRPDDPEAISSTSRARSTPRARGTDGESPAWNRSSR